MTDMLYLCFTFVTLTLECYVKRREAAKWVTAFELRNGIPGKTSDS